MPFETSENMNKEKPKSEKWGDVVCAWCGKNMGKKKGIEGTTHGMCQECYDKEIKKMENEKKEK